MNNDLLEHEIINQIEADLESNDFEALSEMIQSILELEGGEKVLKAYLSDSATENLKEGLTEKRY